MRKTPTTILIHHTRLLHHFPPVLTPLRHLHHSTPVLIHLRLRLRFLLMHHTTRMGQDLVNAAVVAAAPGLAADVVMVMATADIAVVTKAHRRPSTMDHSISVR